MKAADLGNVEAQNMVGVYFFEGKGTEKDCEKALLYFEKAASEGNMRAILNKGKCLLEGKTRNEKKAFECFVEASSLGHKDADYFIGVCYYEGRGVEKDLEKSREFFKKAAEKGSIEAKENVARCKFDGFCL